jgi:hypothetical protein
VRVSRALIVTLALMVSPAAAAVCEVVCGIAPHPAHQAEPASAATVDEHAHHGHHPTPVPETVSARAASHADVSISIPAPECDLRGATPARLRPAATDVITSAAATTTSVYPVDAAPTRPVHFGAATTGPPGPPPLTRLPLRI